MMLDPVPLNWQWQYFDLGVAERWENLRDAYIKKMLGGAAS